MQNAAKKEIALSTRHSALIALIALHLLIALPLGYFLNIWVDEASSLYTTENGFLYAWQNAFTIERQAPFYFWILSLWRDINHSVFFARSLSVIFSVLAIVFFFRLARKFYDEKPAIFITAIFALHPFLIWASLEIRVYSLVILLSVLLLNFLAESHTLTDEDSQMRQRFFFIPAAIIALYTNYYLGFLLAGCFAALLVLRKFSQARKFFVQMLFVALLTAPLVWQIRLQFAANTTGVLGEKSIVEVLQILWNHFLTFVFPTELFTVEEQTWISFLRVWLIRLAIILVVFLLFKPLYKIWKTVHTKRNNSELIGFTVIDFDKDILLFGTISAVIFTFLVAAYFLLGTIYVELRHAAVLFVPLILFVFAILKNILPRRSWIIFAVIYFLLFSYSIYSLYPNLTKRGDWARVGTFIEQNEKPDQPIIIFTTFDAISLPYYYKGKNKILPDERFFSFEIEDKVGSANSWRKQTEFIISEIPPDAKEIWLLTNDKCSFGDACLPLENFIEANYNTVETKDFYLEKVRLLRKK